MGFRQEAAISTAAAGGVAVGMLGMMGAQCLLRSLEKQQTQQHHQHISDAPSDCKKTKDSDRVLLGIDLGGTTINVGVVDDNGTVLGGSVHSIPLGDDHDPKVVVSKMRELAQVALRAAGRSMA